MNDYLPVAVSLIRENEFRGFWAARWSPSLFGALLAWSAACLSAEPRWPAAYSRQPIPSVLFVPTPRDVIPDMLELARVRKDDILYDLGCGDGRVLIEAAKRYRCRAVGVDIDPRRVWESRQNVRRTGVSHLVHIERGDLLEFDLRSATVITLYLTPRLNSRLAPRLKQLKPGSRIVSHQFPIPGVVPRKTLRLVSKEDGHRHVLFLYVTPLQGRTVSVPSTGMETSQ
ncbi:MAG: methyltransferase domain-containing protein [Planctomycetes bacterium]|nr:methyltransferase domain-containing protein [Planctomycetota bacterium]